MSGKGCEGMNKKKWEKIMSEERKPEESLISDENLFKEYFAALLTRQLGVEDSRRIAEDAIAEHRKLFPKKLDKKQILSL